MHGSNSRAGSSKMMQYELEHQRTELGTGQFACVPVEEVDFEVALDYLRDHPNDVFMHKYLLHEAGKFGPNLTRELIQGSIDEDPLLAALMYEACVLNERLHSLTSEFSRIDVKALAQHSPLIYIKWSLQGGVDEKAYWRKLFSENILSHKPAMPPNDMESSIPFDQAALDAWAKSVVPIKALSDPARGGRLPERDTEERPSAVETASRAMERLKRIDLKGGEQSANQASLSPHALKMQWVLHVHVSTGRNHWELAGLQTSYGKGLHPDQARASCLMEVVERVSSFASFDAHGTLHYKNGHALTLATYEDLRKRDEKALNPNVLHLEVPYENQLLHWVPAVQVDKHGAHAIYVPAQLVFLFCNLDEVSLTSGLPSTGLASGNTLEEAKLHALLEFVERDAERLMPYSLDRCFVLESEQAAVKDILESSKGAGVEVQFLDMRTELGIPCYKAFVQGPNGEILKGCAADLDGRRAVASALTEMPYHRSWFDPVPVPGDLDRVKDGDLPNYSSGSAGQDLRLLEELLIINGYRPVYVDLTREDLDIPVVKALIPGFEMFAEFDRFSRFSLRQFGHYLAMFK
jgi:ribosomal protein S12 methylthiotransferase accessory factor YcaO